MSLLLIHYRWQTFIQNGLFPLEYIPRNMYTCSALLCYVLVAGWRHQMETFSVLLALSAGNSPITGEFPAQRPVMRSFDVIFDLRLNKRLSKQSWGWWFEMLPRSLLCHCNGLLDNFNDILQCYFPGTRAILPQCQWSNPGGYQWNYKPHDNKPPQNPVHISWDILHTNKTRCL